MAPEPKFYRLSAEPERSVVHSLIPTDAGAWALCNGAWLRINLHPELFAEIGHAFGGDDVHFELPTYGAPDDDSRFIIKARRMTSDSLPVGLALEWLPAPVAGGCL
jgi:hypothetical protein